MNRCGRETRENEKKRTQKTRALTRTYACINLQEYDAYIAMICSLSPPQSKTTTRNATPRSHELETRNQLPAANLSDTGSPTTPGKGNDPPLAAPLAFPFQFGASLKSFRSCCCNPLPGDDLLLLLSNLPRLSFLFKPSLYSLVFSPAIAPALQSIREITQQQGVH